MANPAAGPHGLHAWPSPAPAVDPRERRPDLALSVAAVAPDGDGSLRILGPGVRLRLRPTGAAAVSGRVAGKAFIEGGSRGHILQAF